MFAAASPAEEFARGRRDSARLASNINASGSAELASTPIARIATSTAFRAAMAAVDSSTPIKQFPPKFGLLVDKDDPSSRPGAFACRG